jgi:hypothetical protein
MPYNMRKSRVPWKEMVMSDAKRATCACSLSDIAAFAIAAIGVLAADIGKLNAQAVNGSPEPLAQSCGASPASARVSDYRDGRDKPDHGQVGLPRVSPLTEVANA